MLGFGGVYAVVWSRVFGANKYYIACVPAAVCTVGIQNGESDYAPASTEYNKASPGVGAVLR